MIDHYAALLIKACAMLVFLVFGSPAQATDDLAVAAASGPAGAQRSVLLPSGIRLHYLVQGPADGPVALLLHGYTDSGESYSRVLPLTPAHARVVVLDQRGRGASERPDGPYTVDQLAADGLAVLDALDVPNAVVVGHSMGSFVARRMAELAPDRVRGLVLLGSTPLPANAVTREMLAAVDRLGDPVDGGREDAVFSPAEQSALADDIPHARLVLVEGIGHSLQWEEPERFAREFVRFFAETTR